ncbi:hypothetical protein ED733_007909 [Metarhizium rileyi]|uniref:Uncharacterized protein n=1 Tax=Metarhizium rileyi (strain RCEF 4871) TaxID=1649241 RepID=A0A5C6GLB9_METRR|nr:hypothetical protein ED733_007909 [Metarhizium rileyi]
MDLKVHGANPVPKRDVKKDCASDCGNVQAVGIYTVDGHKSYVSTRTAVLTSSLLICDVPPGTRLINFLRAHGPDYGPSPNLVADPRFQGAPGVSGEARRTLSHLKDPTVNNMEGALSISQLADAVAIAGTSSRLARTKI